ncbi:WD40-repeat-containing domain protein [Cercophora samala]|uniref:WD40-repeat-containing domain protein n=1 Tax=Cercophora samala TaxID=330535 RepID=A0AA40CWI3_9PEZI|nr:WD40-repeat-containing domain protein [Cercophora samala]
MEELSNSSSENMSRRLGRSKLWRLFRARDRGVGSSVGDSLVSRSSTTRSDDPNTGKHSNNTAPPLPVPPPEPPSEKSPTDGDEPRDVQPDHEEAQNLKPEFKEPSSAPSQSQDNAAPQMWATSYAQVGLLAPELCISYEKALSKYNSQHDTSLQVSGAAVDNPAEPVHQAKMDQVLEAWFAEQTVTPSVNTNWNDVASLLQASWLKTSQPSLPWVAVCLAVENAFNPTTNLPRGVYDGICFVVSRLEWYCLLSQLVGQARMSTKDDDRIEGLEHALGNLYRTVLHYCIMAACYRQDEDFGTEPNRAPGASLKADLLEMERALPASTNGQNIEVQLQQLFEPAKSSRSSYLEEQRGDQANGESQTVVAGPEATQSGDDGSETEEASVEAPNKPSESLVNAEEQQGSEQANRGSDHVENKSEATRSRDDGTETKDDSVKASTQPDSTEVLVDANQEGLHAHLLKDLDGFDSDIGHWLTSTPQFSKFRDWESGDNSRVLWMSGRPGCGKSKVLSTMVRQLLGDGEVEGRDGADIYFASGDGNPGTGSPAAVVADLVQQVRQKHDYLGKYLAEKQKDIGQEEVNGPSAFSVMSEVLYSMSRDERFRPAYFVLDAVDECFIDGVSTTSKEHALDQLSALVSATTENASNVRWLVSIDSTAAERTGQQGHLHLHLDVDNDALRAAARHYIVSRIRQLTPGILHDDGSLTDIEAEFLNKSDGNFLWISLASSFIESHGTPWNMQHILNGLPSGVTALYGYALNWASQLPWEDSTYCERILQFSALASRPLLLTEVADLASLPPGFSLRLFVEKRCFTFLKVVDGALHFVHHSGRQFLESEYQLITNIPRIHSEITQGCIRFLKRSFQHATRPELVSSHYATINWMKHLAKAETLDEDDHTIDEVFKFVDGFFLQWLESLASNKHQRQAVGELLGLETTLETKLREASKASRPVVKIQELLGLIQDATRVLQLHQTSKSPQNLNVRNSYLFYIRGGGVRDDYWSTVFPWLSSPPDVVRHSSPELFALKGHQDWPRSCEYSPDGLFLASSSDDSTIRIWHTMTGELLNVLRIDYEWIYRVIYSSKGFMAALAGGSITVWNSSTYIVRHRLSASDIGKGHGSFQDIAFSQDGSLLAAASGSSIGIWNLPSFDSPTVLNLEGDSDIRFVTFSPDGSSLAVTSARNVALVRTEDGKVIRSFTTDSQALNPRFSPDSRHLAAGSASGHIYLWDLHSEEGTHKSVSGHRDWVRSVSFSMDGTHLASGSDDNEIRIWNIKSGEAQAQRVLKGSEGNLMWVVFSPISPRHLASASREGTIRLWDVTVDEDSIEPHEKPVHHSRPINFIVLSPDGKTIASGCDGGYLNLWDGDSGSHRHKLTVDSTAGSNPPHGGSVHWLAFSPDSTMLVSTATEDNFFLWNAQDGSLIRNLTGHRDWVRSAVFSPDGTRIASASDDRTVRLWDVQDGDSDKEGSKFYRGHSDYVYSLAFSANGRYLASGGDDSYIRVRDLLLGDSLEQDLSGKELGPCPRTRGLAFFPSGDRIISASIDGCLKIWQWRSGRCLETFQTKTETYFDMRFESPLTDYVLTELGAQLLPSSGGRPLPQPAWCSYGVVVDRKENRDGAAFWITYKDRKLPSLLA